METKEKQREEGPIGPRYRFAADDDPIFAERTDEDSVPFRRALARFATGVAVVATRKGDEEPVGITINSFAAVSLTPPLVLWSVSLETPNAQVFAAAEGFTISVLAADQERIARHFAESAPDKFSKVDWVEGDGGLPLIPAAAAHFECTVDAVHPGGDHKILVGRVRRFAARPGPTLVFHDGRFSGFGEPKA